MNNSLDKLKTYFNQAKHTKSNDAITAFALGSNSLKAIEVLRELKAESSSPELNNLCDETIKSLKEVENHIHEYKESYKPHNQKGDYSIFIKINHTLYNALDSFFTRIDQIK